jgi:hypothetical protein
VRAAIFLIGLLGLAAALPAWPQSSRAAEVLAAYVLFAPAKNGTTGLLARAIVAADESCPRLRLESGPRAMVPRRNPDLATGRADFPVRVCEALYPFDRAVALEGSGIVLPRVTRDPLRIVVIGDTGCKGKPAQDCAAVPADWPFPVFARQIASEVPDLVIHVGDYNYRGTPGAVTIAGQKRKVFDAGDHLPVADHCLDPGGSVSQNQPGSPLPDSWPAWRDDFFAPAAQLLRAAPWVFARGNHEICSRAGPGWFYFLDPGSDLLPGGGGQASCPSPEAGDLGLVFSPPYRLEFQDSALIVMDSSKACDLVAEESTLATFKGQFQEIAGMISDRPVWLVMHRPIWALDVKSKDLAQNLSEGGTGFPIINHTLQSALRQAFGGRVPEQIRLVLSGHLHFFQAVTFGVGRPPQLVIGNGGVVLDSLAEGAADGLTATIDEQGADVLSERRFGYLVLERDLEGGWKGELRDPTASGAARVVASCDLRQRPAGSLCRRP